MRALDLINETASLGAYTIDNSTQGIFNKARALRRVNYIKNEVNSRFGGRWPSNYREAYLSLAPLYVTGTVTLTQGSRNVTGSGTAFTGLASPTLSVLFGADGAPYRIIQVVNDTSLVLAQPYQGATISGAAVKIWQDIYRLPPDVNDVLDFVNYAIPWQAEEMSPRSLRQTFPNDSASQNVDFFQRWGRVPMTSTYSTGTVSGTAGTNVLTGSGTSWLSNLERGWRINVGGVYYHVYEVISDTSLQLYQNIQTAIAGGTSYSAQGRNSLLVKFRSPTSQQVIGYSYFRKDYPAVSDDDEDWLMEMYAHALIAGITRQDYIDKNNPFNAKQQTVIFEDVIKNMIAAEFGSFHGSQAVGYNVPDSARE